MSSASTNRNYARRKPKSLDGYIVITNHGDELMISIHDILYLEAEGQYSMIYIKNQRPVVSTDNLKMYEELLQSLHFCRVHKSSIVNLAEVRCYMRARGGKVELSDGTRIEVSQRRKSHFRKAWRIFADHSRKTLVNAGIKTALGADAKIKNLTPPAL